MTSQPNQQNYVHVHDECPECGGCIYECPHRVTSVTTTTSVSQPNQPDPIGDLLSHFYIMRGTADLPDSYWLLRDQPPETVLKAAIEQLRQEDRRVANIQGRISENVLSRAKLGCGELDEENLLRRYDRLKHQLDGKGEQ